MSTPLEQDYSITHYILCVKLNLTQYLCGNPVNDHLFCLFSRAKACYQVAADFFSDQQEIMAPGLSLLLDVDNYITMVSISCNEISMDNQNTIW